jgi:hypothetical protein
MAMMSPRPMHDRRMPMVLAGLIVVLALPIFFIAGWPIEGWALGAVLWGGAQAFGLILNKAGIGSPDMRGSGIVAFGMFGRGIILMVILIVVATFDPNLALAGALVYALAYSAELALGMSMYFSGEAKHVGGDSE